MINQRQFALNTTIGNFAYLFTVEALPLLTIEFLIELENEYGINEVDECITYIAFVLKVNRQVEEIILISVVLIDLLKQHLLSVLVRNVLDHDGSSLILEVQNIIQLQFEFLTVR